MGSGSRLCNSPGVAMTKYGDRGLLVCLTRWATAVAFVGCAARMEAASGGDDPSDASTMADANGGPIETARPPDVVAPRDTARADGSARDTNLALGGMPRCKPGQFRVCEDFEGGTIDSTKWTVGHAGYNGWTGDGVATIEAPPFRAARGKFALRAHLEKGSAPEAVYLQTKTAFPLAG